MTVDCLNSDISRTTGTIKAFRIGESFLFDNENLPKVYSVAMECIEKNGQIFSIVQRVESEGEIFHAQFVCFMDIGQVTIFFEDCTGEFYSKLVLKIDDIKNKKMKMGA